MANAEITLNVNGERIWCDACQLSTAVRVTVTHIRNGGVTLLREIVRCVKGPHDG